jgi:hypothetical protein
MDFNNIESISPSNSYFNTYLIDQLLQDSSTEEGMQKQICNLRSEVTKLKSENQEKEPRLQQWKNYATIDKLSFDLQREKLLQDINELQSQV